MQGESGRLAHFLFENNYADAISDISSAINLKPEQPDYYMYRGTVYYYQQEYQLALNDLNKVLEIEHEEDGFGKAADFYELRAYIYYYLNKKQMARKDVEKAYRLSSDKDQLSRLYNFYNSAL